jgi:hypothetical protein
MYHVQVMIFLDCFTHCSKFDQHRPLMDIPHEKRASAIEWYTLGQKVVLQTPIKIEFPFLVWFVIKRAIMPRSMRGL